LPCCHVVSGCVLWSLRGRRVVGLVVGWGVRQGVLGLVGWVLVRWLVSRLLCGGSEIRGGLELGLAGRGVWSSPMGGVGRW
jgi:hypothetical protein